MKGEGMNDRASQILNLLIKNPDYKVSNLESAMGLTRRQVNYTLRQINESLRENNLPEITKTFNGAIQIPQEVLRNYSDRSGDKATIFYSENERIDIICLYLAVSHEDISLNHLINVLKVSKNTIVSDIKTTNVAIEKYGLRIVYNRQQGYNMIGDEYQVRTLVEDIVQRNITYKRDFSVLDPYFDFRKDEAIHLIREVEKQLFVNYSDASFDFMANVFVYVFYRIRNKQIHLNNQIGTSVKSSREYAVIQNILIDPILRKDAEWISLMFMASNVYVDAKSNLIIDEKELFELVHEMVEHFKQLTLIDIEEQSKFEIRLFNHVRPACFRIMFDIKIRDYYVDLNNKEYDVVKEIINDLIKPIEAYIGKKFPNDELELLTLYFGSQLHQLDEDVSLKAKAVVICSNGLIVSRMMIETLRVLLPEIHFLTSLSIREFEKFESDYDLVFTTDPVKTNIYQYIINPILSKNEQIRLRERVLEDLGIVSPENTVNEILKTIEKYAKIEDRHSLKSELENRLGQTKSSQSESRRSLPSLVDYLKEEWMQITDRDFTWKAAIYYAFAPMLQAGAIDKTYAEKTIESFEDRQSYSFFGKSTAVPHVDAKNWVHQGLMGFTVFKKPVKFPNGNRVSVIAPIAIVDTSKHISAVKKLAEIVMNEDNIRYICAFNDAHVLYKKFLERKWL